MFGLTKVADKVADDQGPAQMDIGAVDSKGKGKGNKGKDHSGQKGKGKDSWQNNSWQKPDTKGKGGKGKSDGKSKGKGEKGRGKEKGKPDGKGKGTQAMSQLWEYGHIAEQCWWKIGSVENQKNETATSAEQKGSTGGSSTVGAVHEGYSHDSGFTVNDNLQKTSGVNQRDGSRLLWRIPEHARMRQGVETLSVL